MEVGQRTIVKDRRGFVAEIGLAWQFLVCVRRRRGGLRWAVPRAGGTIEATRVPVMEVGQRTIVKDRRGFVAEIGLAWQLLVCVRRRVVGEVARCQVVR